ncbi:MAG: flavodoxin family protein [Eubacteriales bacterium]|nr:flavodoxin family protein [Eubacteriales bacterium]
MRYSIVYSSQTGNTKQLADRLRAALPAADCVCFGAPEERALAAPLVFVGFWTDKGGCDERTAAFLPRLAGKRAALFGTAGFGGETSYFDGILRRVQALLPPDCEVPSGFMCQGKMPPSVRARYAAMLEKSPGDARIQSMLDNFDRALSHPDQADFDRLCAWAKRMIK